MPSPVPLPSTLSALRAAISAGHVRRRPVKDEIRENLLERLRANQPLFPGIIGYDETVVPQIVNAVLSRHNFILLGLRGQAKSRILRALTDLLDERVPVIPGCEIHDDPLAPLCAACRARVRNEGDNLPIAWLSRTDRYVEKHYGLLPRANRGIFAINELPDLAGKIQVGLFNILQEGDVQIKGYPVRLPLDVLMVFSANPEDYTARGKIITPLKDRIGSEIRTHYPSTRYEGMAITSQEAWVAGRNVPLVVPDYVREVVEEIAFQARQDQKVDKRSGVSQRLPISLLENVVSNAERRALLAGETPVAPRITDIYAALPAITGKFELEYEGELRGADNVARDIIRAAVGNVFAGRFANADLRQVTEWFDLGGTLQVDDTLAAAELLKRTAVVQGLRELTEHAGVQDRDTPPPVLAAAVDFVLEGLYAQKKISRSEDRRYQGIEPPRRPAARNAGPEPMLERDIPLAGNKKKYYN
jgi:magnesium chelatase subunit I